MVKVLAISGKRHAGKDTFCNFVLRNKDELFGWKTGTTDKGGSTYSRFTVKRFAFADELKELCSECFDIPLEDMYTEEGKNKITHLKWGNLPHYLELCHNSPNGFYKSDELMRVRDVLQEFGTGVMRRMYGDIWASKCFKKIRDSYELDYAILTDWRFPNEHEVFKKNNCEIKTVRLTRDINDPNDKMSQHLSEIALDNFTFDFVLNNQNMSVEEQNKATPEILRKVGWIL